MRQFDPWSVDYHRVGHDSLWSAGSSADRFHGDYNTFSGWTGDDLTSNGRIDDNEPTVEAASLGGQLHLALFTSSEHTAFQRIGHQPDFFMNFLNAPAVELTTVAQIHFGIVLPKLRSLLPCRSPQVWLSAAETPANEQVFAQTYLGLLFLSLSNNFSGLKELPMRAILEYMESRLTKAQIIRFVSSLSAPAARAFSDNLLQCAVKAGNVPGVEFLLSEKRLRLDPNTGACQSYRGPCTLLEYAAGQGNLEITRLLVANGAGVNQTYSTGRRSRHGALSAAVKNTLSHLNLDLIAFLLQNGADTTAFCYDQMLYELYLFQYDSRRRHTFTHFNEQDSEGICLLVEYGIRDLCRIWASTGLVARAMCVVNRKSALRIAELAFQYDLDLNVPVLFPDHWDPVSDRCKGSLTRPVTLIDVIAESGNGELLRMLHDHGALFTDNTFMYAVEGGDWEVLRYLVRHGANADAKELSDCASEEIAKAAETRPFELESVLPRETVFFEVYEREVYRARLDAAIKNENIEDVRQVLNTTASHRRDGSTSSLDDEARARAHTKSLKKAIDMRNQPAVLLLIEKGVSFDKLNRDAARILCGAIEWRNVTVVEALLMADIHPRGFVDENEDQIVPLLSAVEWAEPSIIQRLIFAGADVNLDDMYESGDPTKVRTPLTIAVKSRDATLARLLLDNGAKTNSRKLMRRRVDTPLQIAVSNDDLNMVKLLVARGARLDDKGALVAAVEHSGASLELLLNEIRRIWPHGKNRLGTKALQAAIRNGNLACVKLLVESNLDFQYLCERDYYVHFKSPLATAIKASGAMRDQMVELLLQAGADLHGIVAYERYDRYHEGDPPPRQTALLVAIETGDPAIVELLLRHGADINFPATHGVKRTPLQQAAEQGNLDIVEMLLRAGASVNAPPAYRSGATALQLAAMEGYVGTAELLIAHGANVNGPTAKINGRTAIDGAAEHGRLDMVQFLLRNGATLNSQNGAGESNAVKLAKQNGHRAVADFLEAYVSGAGTIESSGDSSTGSTSDSERPVCPECQSTFKNASSLTRHRRTKHQSHASATTTYKCDLCTYTANRKDTLERHTATQHTVSGKVPCPDCGKQFRKDYLKQHRPDPSRPCKDARVNVSLPVRTASLFDDEMVF